MVLRSEGRFDLARAPRSAGTPPPARHQSRLHVATRRSLALLARVRLGPSAILAAPASLAYLAGLLPGGFPALFERNRALARAARALLADTLGLDVPCPESMLGSMAALYLPDDPSPASKPGSPFVEPLTSNLRERHRIEVPVWAWPGPPRRLLRVAAAPYNHLGQYERLASALRAELEGRQAP
jgi:isopenicillin-N epimerase